MAPVPVHCAGLLHRRARHRCLSRSSGLTRPLICHENAWDLSFELATRPRNTLDCIRDTAPALLIPTLPLCHPRAVGDRLGRHSGGIARSRAARRSPDAFLQASPSGTVPCLVSAGEAIDESLDVMLWALSQHDPDGWLDMPDEGFERIAQNDGAFKAALDRTKYAGRYPGIRSRGTAWSRIGDPGGARPADRTAGSSAARPSPITPYFRLFASSPLSTRPGSTPSPGPICSCWLETFLASSRFECVMAKYEPWQAGDPPVVFP